MRRCGSTLAIATVAALTLGTSAPAQQTPTFRSRSQVVSIYATVRASDGRLVPDLTQADFEIRDNGTPREVVVFSREIVPITAAVMLDMSGSAEAHTTWRREAAYAFVKHLLADDRAKIGTFGEEIAISPRLTNDKRYLNRILNEEVWPGGSTPLWNALDLAMTSLAGETGRRVILALTDGYHTPTTRRGIQRPTFDPGQIQGRANREQFMIYAVGYGAPMATMEPVSASMKSLALETGGGFHQFPVPTDADTAMKMVADELHHQYLLGFEPVSNDGKLHKLNVGVKRGGMTARARSTYVAPLVR